MNTYSRKIKSGAVNKKLEVFDFKENEGDNAADKYNFLTKAAVGKDITTEEIKYVSTLKIDAISVKHVATPLLEDSCRVMLDSDDALIADDQPSESTPELRSGLPESEVSAPAGAEVEVAATSASPRNDKSDSGAEVSVAATSASPRNDKLDSGAEVSVAATSASPSNDKLDSAVLDSFPSPTEPVCSDEVHEMDPHETGSLCERSSASSDVAEDDAVSGENITAEEINCNPSLKIDAIKISHVATTVLEDSSRVVANLNDDIIAADYPPESSPKLRTDLPELEVCAPDGAEFNVATASASPCNDKVNSAMLDLLPSLTEPDEVLEMDSPEDGSMCERSSSSDVAEDDVAGPSSDHFIDEWEMDSEDSTAVVFYPDYVMYRGCHFTDSAISFTSNFIQLVGSTDDGDDQTKKYKWEIEDILNIRSHCFEPAEAPDCFNLAGGLYPRGVTVEMVMLKIHVLTNDTEPTENGECTSGYTREPFDAFILGTELKFAISGSDGLSRLDEIVYLNKDYKALWSSVIDTEDTMLGHNGVSFSKYLPSFDRPFEEVVYPKGEADAVSITKRDFDLLEPGTFLNDTIIDFYIKYLKNKLNPDERHRFHFFNSFFFRKLADPDKSPLDASTGSAGYQRVKKWTRKVSLFEKDFVFIPVNYNYHWSLIVICHLGEVATYDDGDANESNKLPCVLHMDSIRGSHAGLKGLVQSYLREEWIGRQQVASEDISSRFDNLRFLYLELPQQENSFDCGLFLLHYVELFLEQVPQYVNPFQITNSSSFLSVDWFTPNDASVKRVVIQKLICDLLENPYQESSSTIVNDKQCHLSCPTTDVHKGTVVNMSQKDCNSSMLHQSSHDDQNIEISLVPSSSYMQCIDDPNMDLKPSIESESFQGTPYPNFNHTNSFNEYKSPLTAIKEDVEGGEQFVYSQTEPGFQQENDDSALLYSSQEYQTPEPWQAPVVHDHETVNNNIESSPEASVSSEDFIEVVDDIRQLDSEHISKKRRDPPRSPVQDTFSESVQMVDGNGNNDPTSLMDMIPGSSFRFPDMQVTGLNGSENLSGLESDMQHPTKKIRMTEP
ncbi:probable ubiquitin-like-specific protease 2B isoform X1 [Tanacetum coccineum]|uniref:Probable ubiquitin-like-specific protease 2B isoform X1 n=1 Tax=Tanacetum coccineum TaxID=301880 RepID=A0ABQ4XKS6_9ASTR